MWGSGGLREGGTPFWTVGKLSQELRIGREYIAWVTLLSFHGDGDITFFSLSSSRSKV